MPPKIFPPLPQIIHLLKETMTEQLMMVYSFIIHNHCHQHREFVYVINQAVQTMQLSSAPTSAAKQVNVPNNSTKDVSLTTATDCSMIFTHISACADPLNLAPQTQMTPMRTNILFVLSICSNVYIMNGEAFARMYWQNSYLELA